MKANAATLLLSCFFLAENDLGEELGALMAPAPWRQALVAASTWAIDSYVQDPIPGADLERLSDALWRDEVEPRARRLSETHGTAAVEAMYLAALVAILDDAAAMAPEIGPRIASLRELAGNALGDPLSPDVRDAAAALAQVWRSHAARLPA